MNKPLWLLTLLTISISLISRNKDVLGDTGFVTETELPVTHTFDKINVNGRFDLRIYQSDLQKIKLFGDKGVISEIEATVMDGNLFIHYHRDGQAFQHSDVVITVYTPSLKQLSVAGGGRVRENNLEVDPG